MKRAWFWGAVGGVAVLVWLARPSSGAPVGSSGMPVRAPDVRTVAVSLPRSYGELRGVDRSSLYFEDVDGTIYIVHLTLDGEVDQNIIEVTRK